MLHSIQTSSSVQALFKQIETRLAEKHPLVIAVDGRCGSGKSTLAALLKEQFSAVVIPADDFFLRPAQRTPERFAEPGGNIDRERLLEEVLLPLSRQEAFAYRPFDCRTLSLRSPIFVEPTLLTVVEGSYSCHPSLWDYYDLHLFVEIDPVEQLRRITLRNGAEMAKIFAERWIPLEERYFATYDIQNQCEIVLRV